MKTLLTIILMSASVFQGGPPSVRSYIAMQGTYPISEWKFRRQAYESYCRTVIDIPVNEDEDRFIHLICIQTLVAERKGN